MNSKLPLAITVSATLLLCACASPMPAAFSQGSATQQQFAADIYQCELDARSIPGGDCRQMNLYESCMTSKGYQAIPGTANKGSACR